MISESAACRLGIAAYGLASARTIALSWLIPKLASVSTKPSSGNILGGAVGMSTKPTSPITFASSSVFRKRHEAVVPAQVDPEQDEPEDRELRVPVGQGRRLAQQSRRRDEALDRELPEARQPMLDVGHAQAVLERLERVAVGDTTRVAVRVEEPEPDRQLANEIEIPVRQVAGSDS